MTWPVVTWAWALWPRPFQGSSYLPSPGACGFISSPNIPCPALAVEELSTWGLLYTRCTRENQAQEGQGLLKG